MASYTSFRLRVLVLILIYCIFSDQQASRPLTEALIYHQTLPVATNRHQNRYHQPNVTTAQENTPSIYQTNQNINTNTNDENDQRRFQHQLSSISGYPTSREFNAAEDNYGCPVECDCNRVAQIADCSNRNLTQVPNLFPKDIKRIRLERNNITEIGPYAFQGLRRLQRIDLSNNNIYKIDPLAFSGGLQSLNSLLLYSNKLEHLPVNVFSELSQLHLLLLNANSLRNIQRELFQPLGSLNLLSLFDNNIITLEAGSFDGMKNIKTIHLGKNPLNCDCQLAWLSDYLELHHVETTEATCESPQRIKGRKLRQLNRNEFKCDQLQELPPTSGNQTPARQQQQTGGPAPQPGQQQQQPPAAAGTDQCPANCDCNGSTIDCSRASESRSNSGGPYELPDVPDDVPVYVARVHINDNRIKRIRQTGLFRRLANSQKLSPIRSSSSSVAAVAAANSSNSSKASFQRVSPAGALMAANNNSNNNNNYNSARSLLAFESDLGNNKIIDIEDNAINGQFTATNKPERVVFVLLENQHCEAPKAQSAPTASVNNRQQQQQQPSEVSDPCGSAPRVNDPHFDSPCYNGGSCRPFAPASASASSSTSTSASPTNQSSYYYNYSCMCPPGFAGPLCEINIDDCVDHQCQNGAMCVDGVNSYKCICRDPTTTGEYCEQLSNSNQQLLLNTFPYATSSANSIAPIALPIIASSANPAPSVQQQNHEQQQQQPIMVRSLADFATKDAPMAPHQNEITPSQPAVSPNNNPNAAGATGGSCRRVTQRRYYDDGNGCQSVRLLKLSECLGACSAQQQQQPSPSDDMLPLGQLARPHANQHQTPGSCCVPARVKRRRVRMQCTDGASYVKTIDLVKKCACSAADQGLASCSARRDQSLKGFVKTLQDYQQLQQQQEAKFNSRHHQTSTRAIRLAAEGDEAQLEQPADELAASMQHQHQIARIDAVDES